MGFKSDGFDDLLKGLENLEKQAKESCGKQIPINDLLNVSFMKKYTSFSNFDDFLDASGFVVNSQEDFEAIPDDEFDEYVSNNTNFASWDDMLTTATDAYVSEHFGF